jgi:predicted SnoaL-like aldol condensation-catalyzing enzyme
MSLSKKEIAILFLKQSKKGDPKALNWIHPQRYKSHSGTSSRGIHGFAEKMLRQTKNSVEILPIQILNEGDYIAAFSTLEQSQRILYSDILRFHGDKIIEHWEFPIHLEESAHTMALMHFSENGNHAEKGQQNTHKQLVYELIDEGLIRKADQLQSLIDHDLFTYVNLNSEHGILNVNHFPIIFELLKKRNYKRILNLIGEGNQILCYSEGRTKGNVCIFIDLFSFNSSKLVKLIQLSSTVN